MKLHIYTLNWNGGEKLINLYNSLYPNTYDFDAVWHIRDNGSKDESIDRLIRHANIILHDRTSTVKIKDYRISHNKNNFAQGMNYLFEQSTPNDDDLILLLNNDVIFKDSISLNNMYKLMLKTGAAIVGARLLYNNTNKLQHAGVIFGERYGKMPYHYKHGEESDEASKKNRYFQAVTAAVCLIKAGEFNKANGYNTFYNWAFEDIDFNLRIGLNNKIVYCGETNIYHEESASLKKNNVNKLFLNHNVKLFKELWFGKYDIDHDKYLKDPHYGEVY